MATTHAGAPADHVVLYDRDCGFCRWSLGWVLRWDRERRLRPVALQDAEALELLPGMTEAERLASSHLVLPGGEVISGGAAGAPIARLLPGGAPLALLGRRLGSAVDRSYRWVAGHRTLAGRPVTKAAKRRADAVIASRSRPPGATVRADHRS